MDNTTEFSIDPIVEEYLQIQNSFNEALELIIICRQNDPTRWAKTNIITSLNTAFDWDLSSKGFDYWSELDSKFETFKLKKCLEQIKINQDISRFIDIMHPALVKFLVSQNCLPNYIINCINFIEKYGATHLEPPIEDPIVHLRQVRDIINAFRCSQTPEGVEFWRHINEAFVTWKG